MKRIILLFGSLAILLLLAGFAIADGKELIFSEYNSYATMTDLNDGPESPVIALPVSILIGLAFLITSRNKDKSRGG